MTDRHLFVVDDDDAVRQSILALMLTQQDVVVREFRSGDLFLETAPSLPSGLLLLDLHMPGTSGLDVLRAVGQMRSKFATIVLTGQGDIGLAVQAMKLGALDFMEKPSEPQWLMQAIANGFEQLHTRSELMSRELEAREKLASLSPRELDVLGGLVEGWSNKMIAHKLDISPRTVEIYRAKAMEKLEVRSLSEALRIAFAAGLAPI